MVIRRVCLPSTSAMIAIRITGPGMDITLGVESLEDMAIVEATMLRVRERVAVSPKAMEIVRMAAEAERGDDNGGSDRG